MSASVNTEALSFQLNSWLDVCIYNTNNTIQMKKLFLLVALFALAYTNAGAQTTMHHKAPMHKKHRRHHPMHHSTAAAHSRSQHNIKVANDDRNAYKGKHSQSNDGVKKNEHRNLNYQNNGANLAPSDGNRSK